MYYCSLCNKQFSSFGLKANHVRWNHPESSEKVEEYKRKISDIAKENNSKRFGKYIEEVSSCSNPRGTCSNTFTIRYREGKKPDKSFCSRSCANSRIWTKDQMDNHLKRMADPTDPYGRGFLERSFDCEKNPEGKLRFSSKQERKIVNFFKENFPRDEWKSGGSLKLSDSMKLSRDLWSDKLKVCFEYDGIWHFKDIKNQLSSKRQKDLAFEEWCLQHNYRLIRIDEDSYESIQQIVDLVYHRSDSILKVGSRYNWG